MTKFILPILAIIGLILSVFWYISFPSYEPAISGFASITTLVTSLLVEKNKDKKSVNMKQKVSDSSIGYQANGDIVINNLGGSDNDGSQKKHESSNF